MNKSITYSDFISLGLIRDLEILASDNDCVLWIRNKDNEQQLFVSNTYASLWEHDCLSLYRDPSSFQELINIKDKESFYKEIKLQRIINPNYTKIYSINLINGQERWFQDRSFQLSVVTDHEKIIVGCALHIPDKNMITSSQENISENLDFIITSYYQILTKIVPIKSQTHVTNNEMLNNLSKREREIFILFLQGKTITQVAEIIHLSPRTIEGYLITLKSKLECNSKSDLIMKAIENGWLLFNL